MTTNEYPLFEGRYYVKSYGNGWAYEIEETATGEVLFVQDDNARQLQDETEDFTSEIALSQYFGLH